MHRNANTAYNARLICHACVLSTCALVALAAVNALVGGCAATRHALRLTELPEFFERPPPQSNSLDMDDIVGSCVYDMCFIVIILVRIF